MSRSPRRLRILSLALLVTAASSLTSALAWSSKGTGGAVVSPEKDSTEVGLSVLRAGGNAIDAAVATALAMAVVHPEAGNLGGGGFAIVRINGEIASLDFRETAPADAHRDMYLDNKGRPRPSASWVGPLASGVPGSPAGLFELHRRFGSLPWVQIVAPALALASEGFIVSERLNQAIAASRELLAKFPESARTWLPAGAPPPTGSRIRLPDLAATLGAYSLQGPAAIQTGEIARAVESSSRKHGGILTTEDLAGYRPIWRQPVFFDAFGWTFASMGLPSSGGFLVGAALKILERLGFRHAARFGSERAHLLAEVWRRLYADRTMLGDPTSSQTELATLMTSKRLAHVAGTLDLGHATPSESVSTQSETRKRGLDAEPLETNHLSVIDSRGNLVALTTTLNGAFGCGLLVPGAGFFLNNEMDDFSTAPGQPNQYGLVQGSGNEVAAGRRMLSSMSPTLAWKEDQALAIGGRGGSRIPTAVTQVLLNLLVDGSGLQEAIDRPRIHHQWLPDHLSFEEGALSSQTRQELERLGHRLDTKSRLARVHAARVLAGGRFEAAGDRRGPGVGGVVDPEP